MFDDLIRTIKALNGQQISIPNPTETDAEGYIDRECPNDECQFVFKVLGDDWRDIVRDEEVFCPLCGHAAPAKSWFTTEQAEWVKKAALQHVNNQINRASERDAKAWNRRQRPGGFLTITMQARSRPEPVLLPLAATDPMRLKIGCSQCNCRYSVIGSAYFCPSCGHNAADQAFGQSLDKIRASLDILPTLRATIPDKDTAENTVRALIESGLQSAVTALQRFMEALYADDPSRPKARRNAFQNLEEGSQLWQRVIGAGYDRHLPAAELSRLSRYLQMRHLLAHRDGLVDADYVAKSGDMTYREGQRLVVPAAAVRDCVDLVERLGKGMQAIAVPDRK
jgi:uncharacterized Zn finger protein (UPF0148 family)